MRHNSTPSGKAAQLRGPAEAFAEAALAEALAAPNGSHRLQTAMTAGTQADPAFAVPLINRCAVEPDFQVREMLTWALVQLPKDTVIPLLLAELTAATPQAQSQALHTLSKLGDERAWPAITAAHLHHADDSVARTAWRAAAAVAPSDALAALAADLVTELGRGDTDTMRSLSRVLVTLGEAAIDPLARAAGAATERGDAPALAHARATERLLADPDASFALDPVDAAQLGRAFSATSGGNGAH